MTREELKTIWKSTFIERRRNNVGCLYVDSRRSCAGSALTEILVYCALDVVHLRTSNTILAISRLANEYVIAVVHDRSKNGSIFASTRMHDCKLVKLCL